MRKRQYKYILLKKFSLEVTSEIVRKTTQGSIEIINTVGYIKEEIPGEQYLGWRHINDWAEFQMPIIGATRYEVAEKLRERKVEEYAEHLPTSQSSNQGGIVVQGYRYAPQS